MHTCKLQCRPLDGTFITIKGTQSLAQRIILLWLIEKDFVGFLPDINFVFQLPAVPVWVPMVEMLLPVEVDVRLAKVNVPGTRGVVFSVGWHDHHTAHSIANLKHKG